MESDTAGDPMTGLKWTRRTTEKIAAQLGFLGINVSPRTVSKLLKQLGYSLKVNHKKLSSGCGADRDTQFCHIGKLRQQFTAEGAPIVSVDTKKKEMVGNFKNPGAAWNKDAVRVNDHDFRSSAQGMAIPYGIFDLQTNRGSIFVGVSHDTPEFAVSSIAKWWRYEGRTRYPEKNKLLILADCGGSNGYRTRSWKYNLQKQLCDRYGISVTVCHYPSGASKWNPIEHRLFSEISKNWAGKPLDSYETILNYLKTTTTSAGLKVKAYLAKKKYTKGQKVSDEQMSQLRTENHSVLPKWNYTILPSRI